MNDEIWKGVNEVGFTDLYEVSNKGRIRRVDGDIINGSLTRYGYIRVWLKNKLFKKERFIHRLIAQTFLDNPENKATVNHIDCIKTHNWVENLEWATQTENMKHAWANKLINVKKGIKPDDNIRAKKVVCSISGKTWGSATTCALENGINVKTLQGKLNGKDFNNTTFSYFKLKDDYQ